MIKSAAGFTLDVAPPTPIPFAKEHLSGSKQDRVILKGIANVEGVNRLISKASVSFCPKALTVIYGRNGSGKSGFVRILRTACRTRVEDPSTLEILADVYGNESRGQSADIVIAGPTGDEHVPWTPGMAASAKLMQVSVFDTASAQLYVDGGNQIRFLPFGLALPHLLNAVCIELKSKLESELSSAVGNKIQLSALSFAQTRDTTAQRFAGSVSNETSDAEIQEAVTFSGFDLARIDEIAGILGAASTVQADLTTLLSWLGAVAEECRLALKALSDDQLSALTALKQRAVAARDAANLSARTLFDDEPLMGVGSETWRALWIAARNYSLTEAYPSNDYPATSQSAHCVLCQQPLLEGGAERLRRFRAYMDGTLDKAALLEEAAVDSARESLPALAKLHAGDFFERLEQVRSRDPLLAEKLLHLQHAVAGRTADALACLNGTGRAETRDLPSPISDIDILVAKLGREKEQLIAAEHANGREKLIAERGELEDRRILNANVAKITTRRDLLILERAFTKAISSVATTGITKRANEFIDKHLTSAVMKKFDDERDALDIRHLNVGLSRKSGQLAAEFQTDPQTKLTKMTSKILSEGEQRALALTGFLTEVELTEGSGPIVLDDPVSSVDRDRSARIAERLALEATKRQVIVFTHDIVFFNELCRAADATQIEPVTIALFRDGNAAGKIDRAGMVWKGLNVSRRISLIRSQFGPLRKLHGTSPADYEYHVKSLYGRVRDTYERVVEEIIFRDIVRRGTDVIQTQLLRYVTLPDDLAIEFHEGMTRSNTHSHDNPASDTVPVPTPDDFTHHLENLETLIAKFNKAKDVAEAARPGMRPVK